MFSDPLHLRSLFAFQRSVLIASSGPDSSNSTTLAPLSEDVPVDFPTNAFATPPAVLRTSSGVGGGKQIRRSLPKNSTVAALAGGLAESRPGPTLNDAEGWDSGGVEPRDLGAYLEDDERGVENRVSLLTTRTFVMI